MRRRLAVRESSRFIYAFAAGSGKGPDTGERRKREENKRKKKGRGRKRRREERAITIYTCDEPGERSSPGYSTRLRLFIYTDAATRVMRSAPTDNNFSLREVDRARRCVVVKRQGAQVRRRPFFFVQYFAMRISSRFPPIFLPKFYNKSEFSSVYKKK